jgi:hypothetical protein
MAFTTATISFAVTGHAASVKLNIASLGCATDISTWSGCLEYLQHTPHRRNGIKAIARRPCRPLWRNVRLKSAAADSAIKPE